MLSIPVSYKIYQIKMFMTGLTERIMNCRCSHGDIELPKDVTVVADIVHEDAPVRGV